MNLQVVASAKAVSEAVMVDSVIKLILTQMVVLVVVEVLVRAVLLVTVAMKATERENQETIHVLCSSEMFQNQQLMTK